MEILRSDFKVENKQEVFTNKELEFIDATVNGFKTDNDIKVKASIIKKTGAKSLAQAIAYLFKLGVVKCLCAILAFTSFANDITPQFDPVRLGGVRVMRVRREA